MSSARGWALAFVACSLTASASDTGPAKLVTPAALGIEVVSVRPTAAGRMIDLRLRAIDPERAAPLLMRGTKLQAFLIHETTGRVLGVPETNVGAMRQTTHDPTRGKMYFMLFHNSGVAMPGDAVTLAIGDYRIPGLILSPVSLTPLAARQMRSTSRDSREEH